MSARLYELYDEVIAKFRDEPEGSYKFNFQIDATIPVRELAAAAIRDVTEIAREWRMSACPSSLYFNHGSYIRDGIEHIKRELKAKPSSNRALYSLLSQGDISGSADRPIPSFLILQCAIERDVLFCSVYFRALEVVNFFRVNLEEIRQTLTEICKDFLQVQSVSLRIVAFRAYKQTKLGALRRPELDSMPADELQSMLFKEPWLGAKLLREKAEALTVIELHGLEALKRIVSRETLLNREIATSRGLLLYQLDQAISVGSELQRLREVGSHGPAIEAAITAFAASLNETAKVFDSCR